MGSSCCCQERFPLLQASLLYSAGKQGRAGPSHVVYQHNCTIGGGGWCLTRLCLMCCAADIISAVEFDYSGDYLATGDQGGRVVLFERVASTAVSKHCCVQHSALPGQPGSIRSWGRSKSKTGAALSVTACRLATYPSVRLVGATPRAAVGTSSSICSSARCMMLDWQSADDACREKAAIQMCGRRLPCEQTRLNTATLRSSSLMSQSLTISSRWRLRRRLIKCGGAAATWAAGHICC